MNIVAHHRFGKRLVQLADLQQYLADLIAAAPRTVAELQQLAGFSISAIRTRLNVLAELHIVHPVPVELDHGMEHIWYDGPAATTPTAQTLRLPCGPVGISVPHQATVRRFPPVNRRDPLVEALFGPAGAQP